MRKALVIGIDNYPKAPLKACVKDATAFATLIETHANGDPNFEVMLETNITTKAQLWKDLQTLFKGACEIALFYFSGHGAENNLGTYLVTPDVLQFDLGVSLADLTTLINNSEATNKIIILDCCHAGGAGALKVLGGGTLIEKGVTILAASQENEFAVEVNGHGVFTNLLIDALQGGAADIKGHITPGSIYAYIDQSLGAFDQRPVFKTNITEFVNLKSIEPKVSKEVLRRITKYFPKPEHIYHLDPSYEDTNSPNIAPQLKEPFADPNNVAVFKDLQKFQSVGLVVPNEAPFMFFAAMESKSCRLTALGAHYWRLANLKKI